MKQEFFFSPMNGQSSVDCSVGFCNQVATWEVRLKPHSDNFFEVCDECSRTQYGRK